MCVYTSTCTTSGLVSCTRKACLPGKDSTTYFSRVYIISPAEDHCTAVRCPIGSQCEVFELTNETFCNPSCDLDNGGCPVGQACSLQQVQCVRAPCPPVVQCSLSESPVALSITP